MKTLKTTLAALALMLVPGLAAASCMGMKSDTAQINCAEGTKLDAETGVCEPIVTG
ncbi:MAG: adenylosuccinate lyase [Paracoccaceae bacterium]|nr:adenylosuccinate lyase [Loktanella sp.]